MRSKSDSAVAFLVLLVFAISVFGCKSIGGRKIAVQIRDASGLHGGEAVFMAGIQIGDAGEPRLVNGVAQVPVAIYRAHKEAVLSGSIFLIILDPNEKAKLALSVTTCSQGRSEKGDPEVFKGASTQIEFITMCGTEKVKELLQDLTK